MSERQFQIQQCKVQEVQSSVTSSGDETSSRIVSDEEIEKKELEAHYGFMVKIQEVLPAESSSIDTPLELVQNHDESNVFANERRHSEQPESINDTYVLEKDDSNVTPDSSNICNNDNQVDQNATECVDKVALANLTLDTEENKMILKQLKKANASLTQELEECRTNLDETSRALGEATSSRDSCLIASLDYGFVSTVDAEERRQGIRDVGYGIRDTWLDLAEAVPEIAPMTVGEVNTKVTELVELHEHDTQDLYALLEDAQDSRSRISQRVDMDSQRVDLLIGDRMTLQETVWMVEKEAYASREAWAHSIGISQATHQELQTHRDHVYAHKTHLQAHQTQLQL
ncbi:hypothetical protein Tco_1502505 [Tanacetum coccineum]